MENSPKSPAKVSKSRNALPSNALAQGNIPRVTDSGMLGRMVEGRDDAAATARAMQDVPTFLAGSLQCWP